MRTFSFILAVCAALLFASCKGKNTSESNIVLDTVSRATVSIQPEYYFSGVYQQESDTAFFTEYATGVRIGVYGNRISDEINAVLSGKSGNGNGINVKARGYIRQVVSQGDTYDCIYFTYLEKTLPLSSRSNVPAISGKYIGDSITVVMDEDHSAHINIGNSEYDGEWFLSNDTLLYVSSENLSRIYRIDSGRGKLVNLKDSKELLSKDMN